MADRSVKVILGANVAGFVSGMRTAQTAAGNFVGQGLDKIEQRSASITTLSNTAGVLGAGMVAGFGAATKAAIDWESAWAGVLKTVDGSAAELDALEGSLREMARTMPVTHTEIAAVAEAAGQLGVATGDVAEFTETMLMLGTATNMTAEEAATSLARISNIMGTSSDDVRRMGSTIVDLGNNSATTEREIVELGTRLAAAGKQAGLTEANIFAIASTLTSVGVEAEAGGTAMSKVFTSIADAVRDGGDNLRTFAQVAGVTTEQFRKAFAEDAAGAIGMFVEGMGQLGASGESTSQVFKDLGLTDQRLMRAILSAGSATGLWADQVDLANQAWSENSALVEEAEKRFQTAQSQMTIAWNNIKDAAIEFGAVALPMVGDVASAVSRLATSFGELPDWVKSATMAIAGGGGLALLGVAALGKLLVAVAGVKTAIDGLGISAATAKGHVAGMGQALAALGVGLVADQLMAMAGAASVASVEVDALVADLEGLASNALEAGPALAEMFQKGADWSPLRTEILTTQDAVDAFASTAREALGQDFFDRLDRVGTSSADMAKLREQAQQLDAAFAQMAADGNVEDATMAYWRFVEAAQAQNVPVEKLTALFPQYQAAVAAAGDAAGAAAAGQSLLGDETAGTTDFIEDQTDAIGDLIAAQAELAGVVLSERDAQRQLEAAVEAATAALTENGQTLDITTSKGRSNQAALDDIASSGWKVVESMRANGRSQAEIQGVMATTRSRFIAAATAMGMSAAEANRLADELHLIPGNVTANVSVTGVDGALSRLGALNSTLNSINGRTVTAAVAVKQYGQAAMASGGPVIGPGTGTSDSIPAMLSNGEYVIKAAAVDKYGPAFMHAVNSMALSPSRFAQGGSVGGTPVSVTGGDVTVLVENPFTGEYLETRARVIARDEVANYSHKKAGLGGVRA